MTSHVEQQIQARIEAARRRLEADRRRRAELAAARQAGLARRHAQKLARLAEKGRELAPALDNQTLAASGAS
ncbi:hypothetical protein [Streptomyces sp. KN37]|uniref:hypothetical protein n=1 Tax=Streptomyces sp. KN37 TaxID=3090667 RepID=UPI002A74D1DE|nr:hypothetical protein [Streptomyces sp. KN37]WPO69920.1 hypothetical protein R9806_04385 [Streptomyces sp. KN37]